MRGSGQHIVVLVYRLISDWRDSSGRMVTLTIDALDARLVTALAASPRTGILELSRTLGVARGTVQARLDKLVQRGVITGFGPELDAAALGFAGLGFTTLDAY